MDTALKLVTQRGEDIAYVDMRYTQRFCHRLARRRRARAQ